MKNKLLLIVLTVLLSSCGKQVIEEPRSTNPLSQEVALYSEEKGLLDGSWTLRKGDNRVELMIDARSKDIVIKKHLAEVFPEIQGEVVLMKKLTKVENNPGDVLKKASLESSLDYYYLSLTTENKAKESQLKALLIQYINQQTNNQLTNSEIKKRIFVNGNLVYCFIEEQELLDKISDDLTATEQPEISYIIYPEEPNQLIETVTANKQFQGIYTYERTVVKK